MIFSTQSTNDIIGYGEFVQKMRFSITYAHRRQRKIEHFHAAGRNFFGFNIEYFNALHRLLRLHYVTRERLSRRGICPGKMSDPGRSRINSPKSQPYCNSTSGFDFDQRTALSRHVILHRSAKFYPNRTAHGRKMTSCRFSRWWISAVLDFTSPKMDSLKSPCTTFRSSIEITALNC